MDIKLDLSNVFDRLMHDFILLVLEKFGFPPIFIKQIQACISSPWIAPLINGRTYNFFKSKWIIRKEFPLFMFLYILVADSLSIRLNRLLEDGKIQGLSFNAGVQPINHALFMDDTILLGSASPIIARTFLQSLDLLLRSSRNMVNLDKFHLYGWNCNVNTLWNISQILKIKFNHNWTHFSYLGIPITKNSFSSAMWRLVIQKIKNKTLLLGSRWLNLAWKTTLI